MKRGDDDQRMRKVHVSEKLVLLFDEYQRYLLEMLRGLYQRRHSMDEISASDLPPILSDRPPSPLCPVRRRCGPNA